MKERRRRPLWCPSAGRREGVTWEAALVPAAPGNLGPPTCGLHCSGGGRGPRQRLLVLRSGYSCALESCPALTAATSPAGAGPHASPGAPLGGWRGLQQPSRPPGLWQASWGARSMWHRGSPPRREGGPSWSRQRQSFPGSRRTAAQPCPVFWILLKLGAAQEVGVGSPTFSQGHQRPLYPGWGPSLPPTPCLQTVASALPLPLLCLNTQFTTCRILQTLT